MPSSSLRLLIYIDLANELLLSLSQTLRHHPRICFALVQGMKIVVIELATASYIRNRVNLQNSEQNPARGGCQGVTPKKKEDIPNHKRRSIYPIGSFQDGSECTGLVEQAWGWILRYK